jgi:hypothetical protein
MLGSIQPDLVSLVTEMLAYVAAEVFLTDKLLEGLIDAMGGALAAVGAQYVWGISTHCG